MGKNKLLSDLDAEKAVLSACLLDGAAAKEVTSCISADDFYRPAHAHIFSAISEIVEKGHAPDIITVAHRLAAEGLLEESKGRSYLLELADDRFSMVAYRDHVEIIRQYAIQRRIAKAAVCIISESCKPQLDFEEYLSYVRKSISDAMSAQTAR